MNRNNAFPVGYFSMYSLSRIFQTHSQTSKHHSEEINRMHIQQVIIRQILRIKFTVVIVGGVYFHHVFSNRLFTHVSEAVLSF